MKRQIIEIDEEKCDGCGLCVPECHEGAIQMIEGKARLISDLFCDGLGACLGHCPQGAINVIEREAEPYDEIKVMERMVKGPISVVKAHLKHLKDHQQIEFFSQAINFLKDQGIENPLKADTPVVSHDSGSACGCGGTPVIDLTTQKKEEHHHHHGGGGCPGSAMRELKPQKTASVDQTMPSELTQWPVQIHLVSPYAPYFKNRDLVIMSTCGPLASANIHKDFLKDRSVVVGCPKLDDTSPYVEKLAGIIKESDTPKVICVTMEVPCCRGLSSMAHEAAKQAGRSGFVVEDHIMGIDGTIKNKQVTSY